MVGKRAKFEKNKADERRPQELREEDIARSENETTKHVIDVSTTPLSLRYFLSANTSAFFFLFFSASKVAHGPERPRQPFQVLHQSERLCAVSREPVLPLVSD